MQRANKLRGKGEFCDVQRVGTHSFYRILNS